MEQGKKRVLILTADVGFGHRSAANAVAAALKESYSERCEVVIENPLDDRRTPSFVRKTQTDYDKLVLHMPDAYKLSYQVANEPVPNAVVESALAVLLFNVINDTLKRVQPDVVVVTNQMYQSPLGAVIAIHRLPLPFLTTITDLTHVHRQWFYDGVDLLLVPTEQVYQQAIDFGLSPDRVRVTGIPINPAIAGESRQPGAIRAEFGWRSDLTTVLVVGSKRVKKLEGVLHVLNHSALRMQLIVVAGGDDILYTKLLGNEWHLPTHLYNYVDQMPAFLRAADCSVTKAGGLIVSESLACGLPLLFVDVTPGQEEGNADYVIKNGAGDLATDPVQALETLFHWLDHDQELLHSRAQNAYALGRPRSAYEIANLTWQLAEQGRAKRPRMSEQAREKLVDLLRSFGVAVKSDHLQPGAGSQSR